MKRLLLALLLAVASLAQTKYQKPPQEILDVLNAPVLPQEFLSPSRDYLLLGEQVRYPPIAELSEPMLRLAGLRINPKTNGPHRGPYLLSLTLKKIDSGAATKLVLPPKSHLGFPEWSPDGKRFAFTRTTAAGIELWVGTAATGAAAKAPGVVVNAAYSEGGGPGGGGGGAIARQPFRWMPGSRSLLVHLVPAGRGAPPAATAPPEGPSIQQAIAEGKGPVATFEDLLKSPFDEKLFEYYCTSQLAVVDLSTSISTSKVTPVGKPAIFSLADVSPDGKFFLVARVHPPFSYLYTSQSFPKEVEVWDHAVPPGGIMYHLASLPLADNVPIEGVPTGPRSYRWHPLDPATLVWVEALDGGNPRTKASYRDRVLRLSSPFSGSPAEIAKTEQRSQGMQWGEKGGFALLSDFEFGRRWRRTFLLSPGAEPQLLWSHGLRDRYKDAGTPLLRELANGHRVLVESDGAIFLTGLGASPEGDRPFLDRFDLKTQKSERLFRSDSQSYESVVALLDSEGKRFLTRRESPTEPPNYYVRTAGGGRKALTSFPDLAPQLRGIKRQLVTYKRSDGVDLSFTLYLPPEYKEGTRLPTFIWAYPLEFDDPSTAGQVSGSTQRFFLPVGPSHLFLLLRGYAVLDNASMPVVGDYKTANNTYVEQIVMSAKAAIDKAAEMGVTDPKRVGVGGHSYGAFMTANLLANSDLFRAGIARSGAYNRTLTPFGFQSERRTFWEAADIYLKMSPFIRADKIKAPLLLTHGEADNNSGTFPIQSERMYQAIRGNGGTVRLVILPHEAHGYTGRESIEHTLAEMINWLDKYLRN